MSLKEIARQQYDGMKAAASVGVIGLHMASGPMVGFGLGYALDCWLDISPWGKMIMLLVGVAAGFLNVWRDSRSLLGGLDRDGRRATPQE